jgi:hypothetical protein
LAQEQLFSGSAVHFLVAIETAADAFEFRHHTTHLLKEMVVATFLVLLLAPDKWGFPLVLIKKELKWNDLYYHLAKGI